jgi:hypothetical protein
MTPSEQATSQILALFRVVIVAVVISLLAGVLFYFALQRQHDAASVALQLRAQLWRERLPILQAQWRMQHKPADWHIEGHPLHMLPSGWPVIKQRDDCVVLWQVLLAEAPAPLVDQVFKQVQGCRYTTATAQLEYDFQQQTVQFSAITK